MYMYPRGFITGVENVCVCVWGGGGIIGCIFLFTGR